MTIQTAANVAAILARESTTGTAAVTSSTNARTIRIVSSPGLELKRALIVSNEKRDDANKGMARLGGKSVDGSLNTELSVGGAFTVLTEAILRAAYVTSTGIGFATMTTVSVGTNNITATGGDWVGAQGLRVGDIVTLTTGVAANASLRTPITAITSLTISVPAATFTAAAATSTGTLTRLRKIVNATTPTRTSYTIEHHEEDIDLSSLFLGCRVTGMQLSMKPGQMVTAGLTFMGLDRTALTTATSPWFTAQPATTTGLALVADDSSILKAGVAVATFTGFDLNFQIAAAGANVIGSFVGPDIFDNDLSVTGTITGLRSDFSQLTLYDNETEFDMCVVLTEPTTAPKPCVAIYLPRVKIGGLMAPLGGDDGAKIETLTLIIGPKVAATGYDATVASISQSAE